MEWFKNLSFFQKVVLAGALLYGTQELMGRLNEQSLSGEVVVITGGGSGIGRLLGIELSKLGCSIVLWDINKEMVESVEQEINDAGGRAKSFVGDISDRERVYTLANQVLKEFGKVDILVNNAGIVSGKTLLDIPDELAQKTIDVNTTSHLWTVKAFLPQMLERNHGHIVTVASAAGTIGVAGLADYCASKFGAFGFNESLRLELRKRKITGVTTTCVCPYYINTGMFDGVQSPFYLPILEPSYVVSKIITAIKRRQAVLIMPKIVYLVPLFRGLFPSSVFDWIGDMMGINNTMDTFKGNSISVKRERPN